MARYRRTPRRGSRPRPNYAWQPLVHEQEISNLAANAQTNMVLKTFTPGSGARDSIRPFDDEVVLERQRGSCYHWLNGGTGLDKAWYPFAMGLVRVPQGFELADVTSTTEGVDLWNMSDGTDYFWRHDAACNPNINTSSPSVGTIVDGKAKRKFAVGDVIALVASIINPTSASDVDLDFVFNVRFLWRLR